MGSIMFVSKILRKLLLSSFILLAACGGGGAGPDSGDDGGGEPLNYYTVSVDTGGLSGSGLSVNLSSNAGNEPMSISGNGSKAFNISLPAGSSYVISVSAQPGGQSCTVGGSYASLNIQANAVATVSCANLNAISGSVTGLNGTMELRLGYAERISLTNVIEFSFSEQLPVGEAYDIVVATQPEGQLCLVNNGAGMMPDSPVSNISINCSAAPAGDYHVGGRLNDMSGFIILSLDGTEELARTANGPFNFLTPLVAGTPFAVTVKSTKAGQVCHVENGTGIIANTDYPFVDVVCETETGSSISPMVNPAGLSLDSGETVTLNLNGVEDKDLSIFSFQPTPFATSLNPGDSYEVTVAINPPGKVCVVHNSVGVIEQGVVPEIGIECVSDSYGNFSIGGSVLGLSATGLVVNLDGRDSLSIDPADSSYTFPVLQPGFTAHSVRIKSHPAGQICSVANGGYAYLSSTDLTGVNIICSTGPHKVSGYATGESSGLRLTLNNAEELLLAGEGVFEFNTLFSDGMGYVVGIAEQPPGQTCSISNATGSTNASVNNILVECQQTDYAIYAHVAGYNSTTPLRLMLNGTEVMEFTYNTTTFYTHNPRAFNTRLPDNVAYEVSIATQPEGQVCGVSSASGIVSASDIKNIGVFCVTETPVADAYTVGVSVSGMQGAGLSLQLNGGYDLAINNDGYQTFPASLLDSASYNVTVVQQPESPLQTCTIYNGSGNVSAANVTNVYVECGDAVQSLYPLNGGNWLYYVKNDGASTTTATDTACDAATTTGYSTCLNGGEYMQVKLPDVASCNGVTVSDNLAAFNWSCETDAGGIRLVSDGLADGVGLSDLVDFNTSEFKSNYVSIFDGISNRQTQAAVWWSNPVRINNKGDYTYQGEIHLITGNVVADLTMRSHTAVLVEPGFSLSGTVSASNASYLWMEGNIDGASGDGLAWITSNVGYISGVSSQNNVGNGIFITGNSFKVKNLSASFNGSSGIFVSGNYHTVDTLNADQNIGNGIYVGSNYATISNLLANNNLGGYGVSVGGNNSQISNITANDNMNGDGIIVGLGGNQVVTNLSARNNGHASTNYEYGEGVTLMGYWSSPTAGNSVSNVTSTNNRLDGVFVEGIKDSRLQQINVNNNGGHGLSLRTVQTTRITDVVAQGNGNSGMRLYRWNNSQADNLKLVGNGNTGLEFDQCNYGYLGGIITSNNSSHGLALNSSSHMSVVEVTAVNNGGSGIAYLGSSTSNYGNLLLAATTANNQGNGTEVTRMSDTYISSVLSLNNGVNGFQTYTFVDRVYGLNMLTANNTSYGMNIESSDDVYSGLLRIGSNGVDDCVVNTSFSINPGLAVSKQQGCIINAASDATLLTGIDGSSTVVAEVSSDDLLNADDDLTPGLALYENISNWSQFDHLYRSWGVEGSLAFADSSNQGACNVTGNNCRIWDWSNASTDLGNAGTAAAYNVVPLPTVSDFVTRVWLSSGAPDQAYCDINYPGANWDGVGCSISHLPTAMEIQGDGIGDDNYLCEAGETCLYMPNIGSYQGHGNLLDVGTLGSGVDTITLKQFESLGR